VNILKKLAKKYRTDKNSDHNYMDIYNTYLASFRKKNINLLEIGIGGENNSKSGGASLKMWEEFFQYGKIYGIDIYDKKFCETDRIKTFTGSQTDYKFLEGVFKITGELDVIIDDGSHLNKDVVKTFLFLFRKLKNGGYYIIEDTQTSYMLNYGGDGFYLNNKNNHINFFKNIVDKINYQEIENPFFRKDYFCENITEIHFYHNLIIIKKMFNYESSNMLVNNFKPIKGKTFLAIRNKIKFIKYFIYYTRSVVYKFLDLLKIS
jgi:hypothetical protein